MKYVVQFMIIISISFIGEVLSELINVPIPGAIYGFVLLFLALLFKIIKLEWVKDVGKFFVTILPLMFIPPVAAILGENNLGDILLPLAIISVISTVTTMAATGHAAQLVAKVKARRGTAPNEEELLALSAKNAQDGVTK